MLPPKITHLDETISCILALIVYPIAIWISWLIFKRQHCSKKDPKPLIIISTCIASLFFFFLTEIYWICKYASKLSFIFWFLSKSLLKMYQVDIIKHWYSQSNKILNHIFNTLYVLSIILSIFIIISIWFMYDILTLGYKGCELIQNTHSMLWINDKNYVYLSLYYSITFIIFIIIISKSKENSDNYNKIKTNSSKIHKFIIIVILDEITYISIYSLIYCIQYITVHSISFKYAEKFQSMPLCFLCATCMDLITRSILTYFINNNVNYFIIQFINKWSKVITCNIILCMLCIIIYISITSNYYIYRIPLYSKLEDNEYFRSLIHYKDNDKISSITNTTWYSPMNIASKYYGTKNIFTRWDYNIINYPIIPYFIKSKKHRDYDMITIVTQTSMDRLYLLSTISVNWTDVISLAVYIGSIKSLKLNKQIIYEIHKQIETNSECILDIHLLFEIEFDAKNTVFNSGLGAVMYPINHLRNLALQSAKTKYVLLSDIDFIPSYGFQDLARQNFKKAIEISNSENIALIIPAFESVNKQSMNKTNVIANLPLTKNKIINSYKDKQSIGFHLNSCYRCHSTTDYKKWINTNNNNPYIIKYKNHYEPYILVKRLNVRRYDARFRGYGYNKIFHLKSSILFNNITFIVSSDTFLYHISHPASKDKKMFKKMFDKQKGKWLKGLYRLALRDLASGVDTTGFIKS